MTDELEFQNVVVLSVVQALIGAVRSEVVAITVETSKDREAVDLYFLVTQSSEELREIIEEIEVDVAALLPSSVCIASHLNIGVDWTESSWIGRRHRPVFARSA